MRKVTIAAIATAVLLVMGALRVIDYRAARREAIDGALVRADNLALILSEYIGESFRAADASLRQLTLHSRRIGGPHARAAEWAPSLTAARTGLTGVGAISVVDEGGIIRHSTRPEIVGQSRRNEFLTRRAMTGGSDELIVGTPFPTLPGPGSPTQLIIPIGRRLSRADGTYEGTVAASFRPDAPRTLLREVNVGGNGVITVLHQEGVILFREPGAESDIGQSAAKSPVFTARRASGTIEGAMEPGGRVMLTAFRTTQAPPLIIAVSMDRDEVLAVWRREVVDSVAVFSVLAAVLAGVLWVLFRQMDAKQSAEAALARAQALEGEQLRDANDRLAASLTRERIARAEAESASALKDEFLMTVSHELRTPLTAIYGWARMLNQGVVGDRQRTLALRTIERNAEAQTRLIEDLLDVSGVMTGKLKIDVRSVPLADIVRSAIETVTPAAAAKPVRIVTSIEPGLPPLAGDPARLQQIVWNLLSNAVKFTPAGGTVRVAAECDGDQMLLTVSDDGIGISNAFLPFVFERFRQEDSGTRRQHGGLGLGLAIVRSLVELHGGVIAVMSDGPGKGATFEVRLPLARATTTPERTPAGTGPWTRDRLDGLRVLVVDDDQETRQLFAAILTGAGADVMCAATAGDALARIRESRYDVLLSDIEMPGIDGYALGREVIALSRQRGNNLLALAVTAYSRPEDEERSMAAGFIQHLNKPIDPPDLIAAIAACFSPRAHQMQSARDEASR